MLCSWQKSILAICLEIRENSLEEVERLYQSLYSRQNCCKFHYGNTLNQPLVHRLEITARQ